MPPRETEDADQRDHEQGEEQDCEYSVNCDLSFHRYFLQIFDLSGFYFSVDKFYFFLIKTRQRARKCVFHALATAARLHGRLIAERVDWSVPIGLRRRLCVAVHRGERDFIGGLDLHRVSPQPARLQFGGVAVQHLVLDAGIPTLPVEVCVGWAVDMLAVLVEEAADATDLESDIPTF